MTVTEVRDRGAERPSSHCGQTQPHPETPTELSKPGHRPRLHQAHSGTQTASRTPHMPPHHSPLAASSGPGLCRLNPGFHRSCLSSGSS